MQIAQCWDDGVLDDIRLIEILRRHGAKASFNLNAGLHSGSRSDGWMHKGKHVQRLAHGELVSVYDGFLVANHTLTHPHLAKLTPADAEREIREGRDALEQIFGYPIKGFAYPFGSHDETVHELVRSAGHCYARTCENVDHVLPAKNPMALPSNCHFLSPNFWTKFATVQQADGVFYFWGHSYELLTEQDWQEFEEKIRKLSAAGEWVDLPELFA